MSLTGRIDNSSRCIFIRRRSFHVLFPFTFYLYNHQIADANFHKSSDAKHSIQVELYIGLRMELEVS